MTTLSLVLLPSCPQADLESSLRARLELLVEDALAQEAEAEGAPQEQGQGKGRKPLLLQEGALEKAAAVGLPRRALLEWQVGVTAVTFRWDS